MVAFAVLTEKVRIGCQESEAVREGKGIPGTEKPKDNYFF